MNETCKRETSCGKVTPDERDEIKNLFRRRLALVELSTAIEKVPLEQRDAFYERVITDLGQTIAASSAWWETKSRAYQWPSGRNWRVDFETCEVFVQE